jgi:hypothetical protein
MQLGAQPTGAQGTGAAGTPLSGRTALAAKHRHPLMSSIGGAPSKFRGLDCHPEPAKDPMLLADHSGSFVVPPQHDMAR